MNEQAVVFGATRSLVGIVTDPPAERHDPDIPAVVLLNAGLLHRVGPNRTYVGIARALAAMGFTVLRFDFSGMGDSQPRADHMPYAQSAPAETREAMAWLSEHRGARRFLLMGHCAGAVFSFLVAHQDARVVGAMLINPEGGDEHWVEFDRKRKVAKYYSNYYGRRALFSRDRWVKLLTGRAAYRSIARNLLFDTLWYRVAALAFRARNTFSERAATPQATSQHQAQAGLRDLIKRGVALCFVHYEGSTGYEYVRATFGAQFGELQAAGKVQVEIIPQSDHMFTLVARQRLLIDTIARWAQPLAVQRAEIALDLSEAA